MPTRPVYDVDVNTGIIIFPLPTILIMAFDLLTVMLSLTNSRLKPSLHAR